MNEESKHPAIEPELKARIVALVLGEASDFEREELNRVIELRSELVAFKLQMQRVHGLLHDLGAGEFEAPVGDWKLPTDRRNAVLAVIRGEATVQAATAQAATAQAAMEVVNASAQRRVSVKRSLRWTLVKVAAGVCVAGVMVFPSFFFDEKTASEYFRESAKLETPQFGELWGGTDLSFVIDAESPVAETTSPQRGSVLSSHINRKSIVALSAIQDTLKSEANRPNDTTVGKGMTSFSLESDSERSEETLVQFDLNLWERQDRATATMENSPTSGPQGVAARDYIASKGGEWSDPILNSEVLKRDGPVVSKPNTALDSILDSIADLNSPDDEFNGLMPGSASPSESKGDISESFSGAKESGAESPSTPRIMITDLDSKLITPVDSELNARVESERLHFVESEAEELHGPLHSVPQPAFGSRQLTFPGGGGTFNGQVATMATAPEAGVFLFDASRRQPSTESARSGDSSIDASRERSGSETSDGQNADGQKADDQKSKDWNKPQAAVELSIVDGSGRSRNVAGLERRYGFVAPKVNDISESTKQSAAKRIAVPAGLNEKTAAEEAFSTFSLHVSDVSFKLALAALGRGEWPEAAKVRIEEFVNAFDYGDPMPGKDEKVACYLEQSIHPFVQQRNMLRVSMRTAAAGRASNTPLRLTFLLDNSGSMERIDRQQTVRRAFALLAQQLTPIDQVTLISFARQPRLLADKVSGADAGKFVSLIDELPSEGGTNIEAALQLAFEKAREQQTLGAQNRIILLTDGAVNLGNADPESLSQMVTTMRSTGIAFDAAGIRAEGLNDEVLEALTRKGDGRYYLLDSVEAADDGFARQIAGALRPSAKNVKVQVEFNPKRVGRYKLLGFEKHILKTEDFRNDNVDAAEMAAAEAGVAMYQFEARPDGEGDVGSVSVRFLDLTTGQMIENRWPIPYEANAPRPEQATPSLRIAVSAALLAAKLRGEPLGEAVDLQALSHLMSGLPLQDRNDSRVQQLQQMIEQARQLSGK